MAKVKDIWLAKTRLKAEIDEIVGNGFKGNFDPEEEQQPAKKDHHDGRITN